MQRLLLVLTFLLIAFGAISQNIDRYAVDGELYFKMKDQVSLNIQMNKGVADLDDFSFLKNKKETYELTDVRNTFWQTSDSRLQRVYRLKFNAYEKAEQLMSELKNDPNIEYVEKVPFFRVSFNPNDANYNSSTANRWHLDKIQSESAWDLCQGLPSVKIAIVDNAIDISHPDLVNKVVAAIDLADGDNDPIPPQNTTIWSHGTHTSGLAAGHTNNSVGIASISYNCSLIAVKAGRDDDGGQGATHMYEGITWAADNGADVISLSLGGPNYHITMQMVIDYAYNKGIVIVAAAGNNGDGAEDANNVNYIGYPAACNHVISVGATNGNDKSASFSEFGTWIDVVAPGGYQNDGGLLDLLLGRSVYSTFMGNTYGKMQGTSMACPIVAGLCGLMLAADTNMSVEQVEAYLKATCDNIESLQDVARQGMVGAGRINAFRAIQMVQANISPLYADFTSNASYIGEGGTVNFFDESIGTPTSWLWSFPGGTPASSTDQNPSGILYSTYGSYNVTLIVSDGTHFDTITKPAFITVQQAIESAWTEQASGFTSMYRGAYRMSITSSSNAWVSAVDGTTGNPLKDFTRTLDGGNLWTPGAVAVVGSIAIANISAINDNLAWVAMYPTSAAGGKVYRTDNGGANWTQQGAIMFTNTASFLNVIHFFNENEGFCMGDPVNNEFEIYYTTDGGTTWNPVAAANSPDAQSGEMGWTGVYDASGNTAYFGTNLGRIYKSVDKGITWTVTTASGLTDISDLAFSSNSTGMAIQKVYDTGTGAITSTTVKLTIDGGNTWSTITPAGPFWKSDICAVPGISGKYFSVGSDGAASGSAHYGSSYSLDYGANWLPIDTGIQYISVQFLNDTIGWAGGFNLNASQGGIYKWDDFGTFVPQKEISRSDVKVYPNPANDMLHVELKDNTSSPEVIFVVDMVGRIVFNQTVSGNIENISIDISHLQSGMYTLVVYGKTEKQNIRFVKN